MNTNPKPPILYSFRRCPYAMRARLAIASSGLQCQLREIILANKPAHMLTLSPKGTVPVLWLSDGSVLDESLDVINWALENNDPENLRHDTLPSATQIALAEELMRENDGPFKHHLDRYKYTNRYEDAVAEPHRDECVNQIKKLNNLLEEKSWLFGDEIKIADLAILPFIRQFRIADTDWFDNQTDFPNVRKWLNNFLASKRLSDVMKKYELWKDGNTPVLFPEA